MEHEGDLFGTSDTDVVRDESLEERPCPAWVVEHDRAGDLHLAHRELEVVARGPVGWCERHRDDRAPAPEEGLDVPRREPVADRLEAGGIDAGRKAVRERAVGKALPVRLAFRPLMAVAPDLSGIWEVGAELDEAGSELRVEDVEVVDADAAFCLGERDERGAGAAFHPLAGEDPLELLGLDDRHDPETTIALSSVEERMDVVELAVVPPCPVRLCQMEDRDVVLLRERLHLATEPVADLLEERGRRDRITEVLGEESDDLTGDLQVRDIGVEIEPVDAGEIETDMAIQHVVDVHHVRHARRDSA